MSELSHLDKSGKIRMVDVGDKIPAKRHAVAEGTLVAGVEVMRQVRDGATPKGNIFEAARVAGILAAKRTSDLVPLCHPLPLTHISLDFETGEDSIRASASVSTNSVTGVEMEALTAVSVALLTLYDMLKALSKEMHLEKIHLLVKSGGKSGEYDADAAAGSTEK